MDQFIRLRGFISLMLAAALVFAGCTRALVRDDIRKPAASASHCSGSEWVNDSSMAVLPVPVVAFFVPHFDLHEIKGDDYLRRCGESSQLFNRLVEKDSTACIPLGLTRIITLGVFQYCTAKVTWSADLKSS
jgi:hypothetical protein